MARTVLTFTEPKGSNADEGVKLTLTAADTSNNNAFVASGNDLVVAQNTDDAAQTVTVTSVADPYGRSGDISAYSIAAGEVHILGPFKNTGWMQSDGKVYLTASDAAVKFGVIRL